jgi:hypothetical protein
MEIVIFVMFCFFLGQWIVIAREMELVGLFVDFAVPTIAAVGSGLVAYSLTGGEEEVVILNWTSSGLLLMCNMALLFIG